MLTTPGVLVTFLGLTSTSYDFGSPCEGFRMGCSRQDLIESSGVGTVWLPGRSDALRWQLPACDTLRRVSLTSGQVESAQPRPELRFASQAPDTSEAPGAPGANSIYC